MKFNSFLSGCLITLAAASGTALLYHGCQRNRVTTYSEQTTEIVHDTIPVFVDAPMPKDSTVIRYVTVSVPVYDTIKIHHADTLSSSNITVTLLIIQKTYKDSAYEAWISGYMPVLDSIRIFQPITTVTNTITNTEIKYRQKRWGLGIQMGIGLTPNKVEPYAGIGIHYNILTW